MIKKEWRLGIQDRGPHHYSYAVMTIDGKLLFECSTNRELAEHVIAIHNREIKNNVSN